MYNKCVSFQSPLLTPHPLLLPLRPLFPASYVYALCLRACMCSLEFNQGYLTDQEGDVIYLSSGNFVVSTLVEKVPSKEQKMTGCGRGHGRFWVHPCLCPRHSGACTKSHRSFVSLLLLVHSRNKDFSCLLATWASFLVVGVLLWMCFLFAVFTWVHTGIIFL